ncbi:MAG TPA: 4-hydroxy-tetrahydrodipicolinate synthase [bacterium]|nr:4-hydroxy-tetrahydrodipicolinate synthase [bacterium]
MFSGSIVALVTPFKKGKVDYDKIAELCEFHVASGTDAIVPCGTTGEAPTLSYDEHKKVIDVVIATVKKRVPVIAGTGSNSTDETIMLTEYAKKAGADGALITTPYYNKPTQRGLFEHYKMVDDTVALPVILYNVPGRTGVSLAPETVAKLSKLTHVVAIKEAAGSIDQVSAILSLCDITVLSGDDSLTLPMIAVGAKGVISVAANIAPKDTRDLCAYALKGDYAKAKELHYKLFSLCKILFVETNPLPVKTAMAMAGMVEEEFRLPLCPMGDENKAKLKTVLKEYGILK